MRHADPLPHHSPPLNSSFTGEFCRALRLIAIVLSLCFFRFHLPGDPNGSAGPGPPPHPVMSCDKTLSDSTRIAPPSLPTIACAACKYQRRKCKLDCTLAPFFPANQPRRFLNVHRLFGVSSILKIIHDMDHVHRLKAVNTIIFESDARAQYPVGGCYGIVKYLEHQVQTEFFQLNRVLHLLALYAAEQVALPSNDSVVDAVSESQHADSISGSRSEATSEYHELQEKQFEIQGAPVVHTALTKHMDQNRNCRISISDSLHPRSAESELSDCTLFNECENYDSEIGF